MNTAAKLNLPPMLTQYLEYKNEYSDCLILFQVGDFYEVFFNDAVVVAKTLNLNLTSRDKNAAEPIPMCGVPISVVETYLDRLVTAGYSVAVISQTQPAPGGKGMFERRLERIITPGIKILGNIGNDDSQKIVASIFIENESEASIAFADVQTAKVFIRDNLPLSSICQELQRISPTEIILPSYIGKQKIDKRVSWLSEISKFFKETCFKYRNENLLTKQRSEQRDFANLKGYSALSELSKKSVRLLLNYIDETTVNLNLPIQEISSKSYEGLVAIDATTRTNLELVKSIRFNNEEGTLFSVLNLTRTACGAKTLKDWILNPLVNKEQILQRQEIVTLLFKNSFVRGEIRNALSYIAELERIATRLELKVVLPRELASLRDSLIKIPQIQASLQELLSANKSDNPLLREVQQNLNFPEDMLKILLDSLLDNPEFSLHYGGIIKDGFNAELDKLRGVKHDGKSWIAEFEAAEKQRSGINSLKIKYNNVIGYFIEVTSANAGRVPSDYIRRQSTANSERFTTIELQASEKEVVGAEGKQFQLEREIYENIRLSLGEYVSLIRKLSSAIACIDVLANFAEVSEKEDYSCPEINESKHLLIERGKHPVLAQLLGNDYVATNIEMHPEEKNFLIITGPNMGGKSTYLRQTALIVIMAQIGCYVPAKVARIGLVDRIFARLGASDNQFEGESTFMVEMREAAFILASANEKSLVLIDEIGRGTATADGLALARSILEWIVTKIKCRTLFATHFHELTELEDNFKEVINYSVSSTEREGTVVFTHEIKQGSASRSYGIDVAKLAGLPNDLLVTARGYLNEHLTQNNSKPSQRSDTQSLKGNSKEQLSFFSGGAEKELSALRSEVEKLRDAKDKLAGLAAEFGNIDLNNITPLQALNFLSALKNKVSV